MIFSSKPKEWDCGNEAFLDSSGTLLFLNNCTHNLAGTSPLLNQVLSKQADKPHQWRTRHRNHFSTRWILLLDLNPSFFFYFDTFSSIILRGWPSPSSFCLLDFNQPNQYFLSQSK
jgi:hypothetical protein